MSDATAVPPRGEGPSEAGGSPLVPGRSILGKRELLDRDYRVKAYDFRRPDKFSWEQIRTLEIMHEGFARLAATALSGQLRQDWEVGVESIDQLTFQEFMDSIETPTVLAVASMKPLRGTALLQVDSPVCAALLDRLFGGKGSGELGRPATELEKGALEQVALWILGCLKESWSQVLAMTPALVGIETSKVYCQIVPPTEMIVLVTLSLGPGAALGRMNLVIPYLTIEPVVPKLSASYWYSERRKGDSDCLPKEVAYRLKAGAEVLARGEELSLRELAALRPGSLVRLPGLDEGSCRLVLGGEEVARLQPKGAQRVAGGRERLRFAVAGEGAAEAVLEAAPAAEDPLRASIASLEGALSGMRESFERGLAALGAQVRGIEGRQEDFADRIAYGQSDAEASGREARPFARLAGAPAEAIAASLGKEGPQLAALVLAYLDDALASRVLDLLPEAFQAEAMRRLGGMGMALPEILGGVERSLSRELDALRVDRSSAGGVEKVVGILNLTARATEKNVVEALQRSDPELAEEVKRNMFVFEDISLLDDESLRAVAERAERGDLLAAMKPVSDKLRERIFSRFGDDEAGKLREEYARLGKVRLSESDAAGMRVVAVIRELETEGRIFIERAEE